MNPQNISRAATFVAVFSLCLAAVPAQAITISTVPVGNPGNTADSAANSGVPGGAGAVSYAYNIGKYDVTLTEYAAFLNAVAASDPNTLWNPNMATDLNVAGISRSGISGGYSYTVLGDGKRPVTYVSWYDAARFTNWLSNGQGSGGTETGVYNFSGPTTLSGVLPADHSALVGTGTKWFLPTENEWYKAAYYKGGNTSAGYWKYPFQNDSQPLDNQTPGWINSGNFYTDSNGFAVTQSTSYSASQNYLTDVGAYPSAVSPYGSFDMGGDVLQWDETLISGSSPGVRGGDWGDDASGLAASSRSYDAPTNEVSTVGFRVANVPEPHSLVLFVLGANGVWFARGRRRR